MNKGQKALGLAILITSIILVLPNENKKDIYSREDMKNILSLMNTNKTILSMVQDTEMEAVDNSIPNESEKEIIVEELEEKKIEAENKEEKTEIVSTNTPTPSRGAKSSENREKTENLSKHLNNYVLDVIKTYSLENGNYPYLLNNDFQNYNGVTEDIYYQGELFLKAHPSGNKYSHCTGITFEVFFKAMQQRNRSLGIPFDNFNNMSKDELFDFMLNWYVAQGTKSESNLAVAIEKYGLGTRITNLEELRPGDFMDFTRENNIGHAVVFINWIRDEEKIIGFKYWSSQGSTNGISYKEEYFNIKDSHGIKYGNVMIDSLHMARVNPISEYK